MSLEFRPTIVLFDFLDCHEFAIQFEFYSIFTLINIRDIKFCTLVTKSWSACNPHKSEMGLQPRLKINFWHAPTSCLSRGSLVEVISLTGAATKLFEHFNISQNLFSFHNVILSER